MENAVLLQWKSYSVPTERLSNALKNLIGSNYDGMICNANSFQVVFKENPSESEVLTLQNFWDAVVENQFSLTLREIISDKINQASSFGRALILDAAVENVELGVTQAGKTRIVANYCANIQRYLESGSLYAAIEEIDRLIAEVPPVELSPYITIARLQSYKAKILTFLGY